MGSTPSKEANRYAMHSRATVYDSEGTIHRKNVKRSMRDLRRMNVDDYKTGLALDNIFQIYLNPGRNRVKILTMLSGVLVEEGILEVFVKFWDQWYDNRDDPEEFYNSFDAADVRHLSKLKLILQNFSDFGEAIPSAYNGDVIERVVQEFAFPRLDVTRVTEEQHDICILLQNSLGLLHNLVRHASTNKTHVRKNNGIEKIAAYTESKIMMIKASAFIVLAYCIDEDENSKINADGRVIGFLLSILRSGLSNKHHLSEDFHFSVEETLSALHKLATNDDNKKTLVERRVLPMLTKLLEDKNSTASEHLKCVDCVWSLSFHEDNKEKIIQERGLIDGIKKLSKMPDISNDLKIAIQGVVFALEKPITKDATIKPKQISNQSDRKQKHIMISYNWGVQKVMRELKEYLKNHGYDIWMDIDQMGDDILDSMAQAVQNSSLVVFALTESYKDSNNCRTEASYAYKRGVPMLPLRLQADYDADGWLGAVVGMKKYVDLSSADYKKLFPDVLKEVQTKIAATDSAPAGQTSVDSADGNYKASLKKDMPPPCQTWSVSEVQSWCSEIGITGLQNYDGRDLSELSKIQERSPDEYYRILNEELHLDFKARNKLSEALRSFL